MFNPRWFTVCGSLLETVASPKVRVGSDISVCWLFLLGVCCIYIVNFISYTVVGIVLPSLLPYSVLLIPISFPSIYFFILWGFFYFILFFSSFSPSVLMFLFHSFFAAVILSLLLRRYLLLFTLLLLLYLLLL